MAMGMELLCYSHAYVGSLLNDHFSPKTVSSFIGKSCSGSATLYTVSLEIPLQTLILWVHYKLKPIILIVHLVKPTKYIKKNQFNWTSADTK